MKNEKSTDRTENSEWSGSSGSIVVRIPRSLGEWHSAPRGKLSQILRTAAACELSAGQQFSATGHNHHDPHVEAIPSHERTHSISGSSLPLGNSSVDVKGFRLVVADSYERRIVKRAAAKRGLDRAVPVGHCFAHELERLLRLGASSADVNAVDFCNRFRPPGAREPPFVTAPKESPTASSRHSRAAARRSRQCSQLPQVRVRPLARDRSSSGKAALGSIDRARDRACDTRVDARRVRGDAPNADGIAQGNDAEAIREIRNADAAQSEGARGRRGGEDNPEVEEAQHARASPLRRRTCPEAGSLVVPEMAPLGE
jgi:hypothetical protein